MPGSIFDFSSAASRANKRADLDAERDRAVGPARDDRPGLLEPVGELVAHPLVDRGRRVGADRVLERLELTGPVGLDHRPALAIGSASKMNCSNFTALGSAGLTDPPAVVDVRRLS